MAFVNEWIAQEDIEKYGLVALCAGYSQDDSKYVGAKNPKDEIDWTIDRERWLIRMASVTNPKYDLPSPTQETIFILHYQGANVEVRLWWDLVSKETSEHPRTISWKYLSMNPNHLEYADEKQLKTIVCEALQTYKQLGIRSEKTNNTEIVCIGFEGGE